MKSITYFFTNTTSLQYLRPKFLQQLPFSFLKFFLTFFLFCEIIKSTCRKDMFYALKNKYHQTVYYACYCSIADAKLYCTKPPIIP